MLTGAGADVNKVTANQVTPLKAATSCGHNGDIAAAQLLLQAGADAGRADRLDRTALAIRLQPRDGAAA
jgi:ankyrin repeat protein